MGVDYYMYIPIIILRKLKNQLLMLKTEFIKNNFMAINFVKKISFLQGYMRFKKMEEF